MRTASLSACGVSTRRMTCAMVDVSDRQRAVAERREVGTDVVRGGRWALAKAACEPTRPAG